MKNIIIVILVVILVGGAIWFLSTRTPEESTLPEEEITSFEECIVAGYTVLESYPRQCQTPDGKAFIEEIEPEDETADWKTYKNEGYGFEMKYPSNWKYGEDGGEPNFYSPIQYTEGPPPIIWQAHLILHGTGVQTMDEYIADKFGPTTNKKMISNSPITLNNLTGREIVFTCKDCEVKYIPGRVEKYFPGTEGKFLLFSRTDYRFPDIPDNNYIFIIGFFYYKNDSRTSYYLETFNQILSTFRFSEELCFKGKLEWAPRSTIQEITDKYLEELIINRTIEVAVASGCSKEEICKSQSINWVDGQKIELNEDEIPEYIVILGTTDNCIYRGASGNGPIDVYGFINGQWSLIGELYGNMVAPMEIKTNGYLNLVTHLHSSAVAGRMDEYNWDGKKYELKKTIEYSPEKPAPYDYWELFGIGG